MHVLFRIYKFTIWFVDKVRVRCFGAGPNFNLAGLEALYEPRLLPIYV